MSRSEPYLCFYWSRPLFCFPMLLFGSKGLVGEIDCVCLLWCVKVTWVLYICRLVRVHVVLCSVMLKL